MVLTASRAAIPAARAAIPAPRTRTERIENSVQGNGRSQWEFSGAWAHQVGHPFASAGTRSYASITDASAKFRFADAALSLYGEKNNARGVVGVSMDGAAEVLTDLYAAGASEAPVLLWSLPYMSGSHTVIFRITGAKNALASATYLVIDAMDVVLADPRPAPQAAVADRRL